jgi:hypothetical protein
VASPSLSIARHHAERTHGHHRGGRERERRLPNYFDQRHLVFSDRMSALAPSVIDTNDTNLDQRSDRQHFMAGDRIYAREG